MFRSKSIIYEKGHFNLGFGLKDKNALLMMKRGPQKAFVKITNYDWVIGIKSL